MVVKKAEAIICAYLGGWERMLSASRLADALDVSREHASRKIMTWARKAFRLSKAEGSRKTVHIEECLAAMPLGLRTPRQLMTNLPGITLVCGDYYREPSIVRLVDQISAEGDPDIFQDLYSAMCRKEALLLNYKAKSGELTLWFSPHALVDIPQRPHFRGQARWARGDFAFIDLVPSRVVSVDDQSRELYTGPADDSEWNNRCDLTLRLSDNIPVEVREVMVQEWGHQLRAVNGQMVFVLQGIRFALLQYIKDAILWRTFHGSSYQVWQVQDQKGLPERRRG